MKILLTGFSCVGKTTLAELVTDRYNLTLISPHSILRSIAIDKGYHRTREWVLHEDINIVSNEFCERLTRNIIKYEIDRFLIDDMYDFNSLLELRKNRIVDSQSCILNIETDLEGQVSKMMERLNCNRLQSTKELEIIDGFKKRSGIDFVIESADHSISNIGRDRSEMLNITSQIVSQYDL